jgi:5-methylcytosine-specific restriction endonuclease McrA
MVYVLSRNKKQLMPCTEKRARLLRERGRARVHSMEPYTIRLVDRIDGATQPVVLKLDPGSKKTGIALVRLSENAARIISLIEVEHRGAQISKALKQRVGYRRRRRSKSLRYRAPRFNNRHRPEGWLAPSLQHRVDVDLAWVRRLQKRVPLVGLVQELVRFDTQLMQNAEITGAEYQQGTLAGYELREYIFAKWGRQCVYCDTLEGPFNLDHLLAQANGGSDRASNFAPSCIHCNKRKGKRDIRDFLAHDLARAERILRRAKVPLKDAAAVNSTRWALCRALIATGLPVAIGTGGRTKWNRKRYGIPKTHAFDAACVGVMDDFVTLTGTQRPTLEIKATGRGAYQRTLVTKDGFPRGYLMRQKRVHGFATGDLVRAVVPTGKKAGTHTGRVAVRASGSFNIQTGNSVVQGISWKHCRLRQRSDGYRYHTRFLPDLNADVFTAETR